MKTCHHCNAEWDGGTAKRQPGFKDACEQCGAYLHCCLNCRFYDPKKHNQCHIPTTEYVADKRHMNYCEDFEFRNAVTADAEPGEADKARERLDSVFGAEEDDTPDLDKLFGD
jgi:hypothetical protein